MKTFDVKTVQIDAPFDEAFNYIANAQNLPEWTSAFKAVTNGSALPETPNGSVEVILQVHASRQPGTIDWLMTFPDGNVEGIFTPCGLRQGWQAVQLYFARAARPFRTA